MTWTRLHDACQHRDYKTAMAIVQSYSEEAMMIDEHGSTPLHIVCWGNPSCEVVRALLRVCPHATTDKDMLGNTPLHIAAGYPKTDPTIIREILSSCPIAASIVNNEGLTPLHMACRYAPRNEAVISSLIDAYPYALRTRTKMGTLAPSKTKQNNACQQRLHFVTDLAGKSNLASSDVMHGALNHQVRSGSYPLHMAVRAGAPLNVVERILREGNDLLLLTNKHGETVLHVALSVQSNEDVINHILDETTKSLAMSGIQDKRDGNLPIHTAAMYGCSVNVAKELILLRPKSIHVQNKKLKTPLDLAIEHKKCSDQVIRLLEISDHSESSL